MQSEEVLAFVEALAITDPPFSPFETATLAEPAAFADEVQAFVVGSQIASFADGFEPDLRAAVSNVFLLAQLAADKALQRGGGGTETWYRAYVTTLTGLGLTSEGLHHSRQDVSGTFVTVHNAALEMMKGLLGPGLAATAAIVKLLEGLNGLGVEDQPWITLFDQKSRRAEATQFQLVHGAAEGDIPVMYLSAFELAAEMTHTQLLFFKFNESDARLSHISAKIVLDPAMLERIAPRIHAKLGAHIDRNIDAIDIQGLV